MSAAPPSLESSGETTSAQINTCCREEDTVVNGFLSNESEQLLPVKYQATVSQLGFDTKSIPTLLCFQSE